MAKTIKFNLIMDGKAVRNLDGLQENFCIEDLLKYHKNGLLLRWLEVRGYQEETEQVKNITTSDDREIIRALAKIFKLEVNDKKINEATEILSYLAEERKMNNDYRKGVKARDALLQEYHDGYVALLDKMERDKDDMTALKADAINLTNNYERLFALDCYAVYYRFCGEMPKVILSILSMDKLRKYWDEMSSVVSHLQKQFLSDTNKYAEIFGESLKTENRDTNGMWDNIAQSGVELLVLRIVNGTFVKNYDNFEEKLSAEDVNGKFLKFHGLQYQCTDKNKTLFYVEV